MTTSTLVPNADVSNTSWTRSSGTTDYNLLSDSSDASYLQTATNGAQVRVNFGTVSLPAGAYVKSVTFYVRNAYTAGTPGIHVSTSWGAGYALTTILGHLVSPAAAAWQSVATLIYTPNSSTPWAQADIDALCMELTYDPSRSGTVRVYDLKIEVLYAAAPTVSVGTVTNASTSTPTVPWTYTAGSDGGPQTRYEVKVFDSATYGAGGFSPDTSTPAWETTGYTTDTSVTIPAGALTSSTTYKAYVRVAQSPVGGYYQTSAGGVGDGWAVSSAFTVQVVKPAPVTLTVTPDQTNERVALDIQGHDNLLTEQDADFETVGSAGTWASIANCSVAQSAAQAISPGTGSLRIRSSAAGDFEAGTPAGTSGYPVVAGRTYRFRGSLRAAATTRTCKIGARYYDSGGTIIGAASYSATASVTSGAFVEFTLDATAPAGAVYARISAHIASAAAANEDFYLDHVGIQETAGAAPSSWYRGGLIGTGATGTPYYAVEASDDAGVTWETVYGAGALTAGANQLVPTFYDYAFPPGGTRQYRAYEYYEQSDTTTVGDTSAGSQTATLDLTDWRLVNMTTNASLIIDVIGDGPKKRAMAAGRFQVLGTKYPVVIEDSRKSVEAQLIVRTSTLDERDDLVTFLDDGGTLLLQGPSEQDGGARWVNIGDTEEAREVEEVAESDYRLHTLDYVEVATPL